MLALGVLKLKEHFVLYVPPRSWNKFEPKELLTRRSLVLVFVGDPHRLGLFNFSGLTIYLHGFENIPFPTSYSKISIARNY